MKPRELPKGRGVKAVVDEHLVVREHYNPNNFAIHFQRQDSWLPHIRQNGILPGPNSWILKPSAFVTLPHGYYIVTAINGPEMFQMVTNYGSQRGIGNKLPSRPEVLGGKSN